MPTGDALDAAEAAGDAAGVPTAAAAAAAAAAEPEAAAPTILALPAEVEVLIYGHLSANDLAACLATCRAWRTSAAAPALWRALCQNRWRFGWDSLAPHLEQLRSADSWQELYGMRRRSDGRTLRLLEEAGWPDREQATRQQLHEMSFPSAQDVLKAAVAAAEAAAAGAPAASATSEPDIAAAVAAAPCSLGYWAKAVYKELLVRHCVQQLSQLSARVAAAAAELARRAAAPAGVASGALGAASVSREAADAAISGGIVDLQLIPEAQLRSLVALSFERGALALAQIHHPFEGVEGGLPALRLLGQLLFGEGPPPSDSGFASIPPPDGYGLELKGNRERYYDPSNSLLDSVLTSRQGIPISLGVLHAAVGARAGLRVQLLNVPMHVVTALDAPGDSAPGRTTRCFVDVFDGGRIMSRRASPGGSLDEFAGFLEGLALPANVRHEVMTPQDCWSRMCRNLLNVHLESEELDLVKSTGLLLAAAAGPQTLEGARAVGHVINACIALKQFQDALEHISTAGAGAAVNTTELQAQFEALVASQVQEQMKVRRRQEGEPGRQAVEFRVGQVMRHKRYDYRGVIVGWDTECCQTEAWMRQMGVDRLPGGRRQPFYRVLPDPEERPSGETYVAQENIELEPLPALHRNKPGYALHPECGRYFSSLAPGGARYVPCPWLRHCYPDD